MDNLNTQPPFFGPAQPLYPHLLQLLRITAATVPGPQGYTSSSQVNANLYIAYTEQLRTDTLNPRDREPCLADDVNGFGLTPGYYLGRLAGQYNGLPVYEAYCCPPAGLSGGSSSFLEAGTQTAKLLTTLTPAQIAVLNNLNPCQLQTFIQLNPSQMQYLTTNLTASQLANLVDTLTYTQLSNLVSTQLTQTVVISSAYPPLYSIINQSLTTAQADTVLGNLSSQQLSTLINLTSQQIQTIMGAGGLTLSQLQTLTNLTAPQVATLVGQLTSTQISSLLTTLTTGQLQQLTNTLTANQIQTLMTVLTASNVQTLLTNLTASQLTTLTKYDPSTIEGLFTVLTASGLSTFLNVTGPPPNPVLGSPSSFPEFPIISSQPSSVPYPLYTGYTPVVVDLTGKFWAYIKGTWTSLGSGGASNTVNSYTGTTTNVAANVFDYINANGVHGSFSIKNTGGANSLNWNLTITDMYGNSTGIGSSTVTPGQIGNYAFESDKTGSGLIQAKNPIKEAVLSVQDTSAGSHTTYDVRLSVVG